MFHHLRKKFFLKRDERICWNFPTCSLCGSRTLVYLMEIMNERSYSIIGRCVLKFNGNDKTFNLAYLSKMDFGFFETFPSLFIYARDWSYSPTAKPGSLFIVCSISAPWFSITHFGSIWESPSGSNTTVW